MFYIKDKKKEWKDQFRSSISLTKQAAIIPIYLKFWLYKQKLAYYYY